MSDGTGRLWPIGKGREGDHVVGDGLLLHYGWMNLDQNRGAHSTDIDLTFARDTFVDFCLTLIIE